MLTFCVIISILIEFVQFNIIVSIYVIIMTLSHNILSLNFYLCLVFSPNFGLCHNYDFLSHVGTFHFYVILWCFISYCWIFVIISFVIILTPNFNYEFLSQIYYYYLFFLPFLFHNYVLFPNFDFLCYNYHLVSNNVIIFSKDFT